MLLVKEGEWLGVCARANTIHTPGHQHLPLYLTHLLTYLYKQASSVSSIRVSVNGECAGAHERVFGVRARALQTQTYTPTHFVV